MSARLSDLNALRAVSALLALGVITGALLLRPLGHLATVLGALAASYAVVAVLLPSRSAIARITASLQLGAGLGILAVSSLVAVLVASVHGPVPTGLVVGLVLWVCVVLPYLVVIPMLTLRGLGVRGWTLVRPAAVAAVGAAVLGVALGGAVRKGSVFPAVLPLGLVPGRDAVVVVLGDKTARLEVDDLVRAGAYEGMAPLLALAGSRLHVPPADVLPGTFRRERVTATPVDVPLTPANVEHALVEAAGYLARNVGPDGRLRYLVDATTNRERAGYSWPRHGGTTWALAALARHLPGSTATHDAAERAGDYLHAAIVDCGAHRCVDSQTPRIDVGASALGLVAFEELGRTDDVIALAAFLRSQVRADGELMHEFDRARGAPIDVQYPYYSGEAALALARTGDPRDEGAARGVLAHLVSRWSFFGSRYWYDEEHWTCQAASVLHDRAALDLCKRWCESQPRLDVGPFDVDGADGVWSIEPPRVTPTASRTEGLLALLEAAPDPALEAWARRSLAFLLRQQLRPGPLVTEAARGGFPATATDLEIRIDHVQHAALALMRWQALERSRGSR